MCIPGIADSDCRHASKCDCVQVRVCPRVHIRGLPQSRARTEPTLWRLAADNTRLCEGTALAGCKVLCGMTASPSAISLGLQSRSCGPAHRPATPGLAAERVRLRPIGRTRHLHTSPPADTGGRPVTIPPRFGGYRIALLALRFVSTHRQIATFRHSNDDRQPHEPDFDPCQKLPIGR